MPLNSRGTIMAGLGEAPKGKEEGLVAIEKTQAEADEALAWVVEYPCG